MEIAFADAALIKSNTNVIALNTSRQWNRPVPLWHRKIFLERSSTGMEMGVLGGNGKTPDAMRLGFLNLPWSFDLCWQLGKPAYIIDESSNH